MPPKKGKVKSAVGADNTPAEIVKVQVSYGGSVNVPVCSRMGHVSYIHPKSGLLYVVGGCDVKALPQAVKTAQHDNSMDPMPFAEWWNTNTHTWGVDTDPAPQKHSEKKTERPEKDASDDVKVGNLVNSQSHTTLQSEFVVNTPPIRVPDGFSWPTLGAAVVHWGQAQGGSFLFSPLIGSSEKPTFQNDTQQKDAEATREVDDSHKLVEVVLPSPREHPVVFFIGGWTGTSRVSHIVGVDMDSGTLLQFHGGMPSSFSSVTCLTGSVFQDCVYVFGGNTNGGCMPPAMRGLDLASHKWCEQLGGKLPISNPHYRSSHVAGLLLNRYIVIHGGRRQAQSTVIQQKGKKVDSKAAPPIDHLNLDFCTDVAVYNVEKGEWITTTINVGSQGPAPRYGHAACVLSPSELLLHGGIGACGNILSDAWILRLYEKSESTPSVSWAKLTPYEPDLEPLPVRYNHAMTASGRRVYITGGIGGLKNVDDVCIMDIDHLMEITVAPLESSRRTVTQKEPRRSRA